MSGSSQKARSAWQDRFRTPTVEVLIRDFNKQLAAVVNHARDSLLAAEGAKEEVGWHGVWRWTMVYRLPGNGERGWAYLVPDPSKPRLTLPIADEAVSELPIKKLSKFIRDGLSHAPTVDGIRWAQWELQNKTQVDDILSLAGLRKPPAKPAR